MECPRQRAALVVLTLLQLCRAEHILPQWYSVNLNEGFQPKPISEIFSTAPSFSTAKPIVVTEKISNSIFDEIDLLSSTMSPPTSQSGFTKTFAPTTISSPLPPLFEQNLRQLDPLQQVNILPQQPNLPNYVPPVQLIPLQPNNGPQVQFVTEAPPQFQRNANTQQLIESGKTSPSLPLSTFFQSTQTPTVSLTQEQSLQQSTQAVANSPSAPGSPLQPNSNYFLIYQQAPQSVQYTSPSSTSLPGTSEVTIRQSTPSTVSLPPRTSETFSTTRTLPTSSLSTTTPLPTTWLSSTPLPTTWLSSTPLPNSWLSTTPRPTDWTSTLSSSSVTVTPSSTFGLNDCRSTTAIPSALPNGIKRSSSLTYPLKIRVIAPTGSITNVNINPQTTTKKPRVTRTTTRKPTTRRTSKPKKNNYDRCLDGCKKVRDPICAAPLSHRELDPKTLRGFPSVCHMACHNSYRKDPFEKVIEGSCSKLRTRIRLIDSRTKLKKEELHKTAYSIDNDGPKTVIELSGLA